MMYNAYEMDCHIQKHQQELSDLLKHQASKGSNFERKMFKFQLMRYEISIRPVVK